MQTTAEQVAEKHLAGDGTVTIDDITRAAGAARRALLDVIGVRPQATDGPPSISIRDILQAKYGSPTEGTNTNE